MERLPDDPILEFNSNTLQDMRRTYNLDRPEALKAAIDNLEDWVKKQNHFKKKDFSRDYLERTLIFNKGSVEKSKRKIDKLCTLRGLMPKYFVGYDLKKDFDFEGAVHHAFLPKMTNDNTRIFILRNVGQKFKSNMVEEYFKAMLVFMEYLKAKDYSDGISFLIDYTQVNLTDLAMNMNPIELKQVHTLLVDGYSTRMVGIHILSPSKLVDLIVSLFKQIVSEKLAKRITVHAELRSLYEYLPKDILPSDYGGQERSLEELHNEWVDVLTTDEAKQLRASMAAATTDETLRAQDKFNEEYMGMPGSFRSFSLD